MMRRLFLPLFCLLLASAGLFAADTVIQEIVARINGDIITRADYQRGDEQLMNDLRQQYGAQADQYYKDRQKDILRDLIDQQLLLQKGKDLGITGDTELVKRLDEIRKQLNLSSMEDLEKAAQKEGVSYEDFKQNIRNGIITQEVISREVGSRIGGSITREEIQKFYDEHKKDMEQPEQVRLEEILCSTEPKGGTKDQAAAPADDPAALAAAKKKAQDLLDQIHKGASFEDLAKQFSDDANSAPQGGDLGYFKRGALMKELEDVTFSLKAGEVSDVIRTKQGYILLKVSEHVPAGVPPIKVVEPKIEEALYYQKLQPAVRVYLTKLREEAYIDIKAGFTDTGASPNETKPIVFTTPAAEQATKKKKKKHFILF